MDDGGWHWAGYKPCLVMQFAHWTAVRIYRWSCFTPCQLPSPVVLREVWTSLTEAVNTFFTLAIWSRLAYPKQLSTMPLILFHSHCIATKRSLTFPPHHHRNELTHSITRTHGRTCWGPPLSLYVNALSFDNFSLFILSYPDKIRERSIWSDWLATYSGGWQNQYRCRLKERCRGKMY